VAAGVDELRVAQAERGGPLVHARDEGDAEVIGDRAAGVIRRAHDHGAEQILRLYGSDRRALTRLATLQTAADSTAPVLHPPDATTSFSDPAALSAAFVPVFTELLQKGRKREAFRLASTLFWVILIGLGALTAVWIAVAGLVVPLFTGSSIPAGLTAGLSRVLFPVGGYRKGQARELAREAGLAVADKPDSVEICFVPDGDHASLIRQRRPQHATAGHIVDTSGKVLAEHDGIEQFTIRQRKGLGFSAGKPLYVLSIDRENNRIVVGDDGSLRTTSFEVNGVNWLSVASPGEPVRAQVKIRHKHEPASAMVEPLSDSQARVIFDTPQRAITPGQGAVFYDGHRVLGGAWIR